MLEKLTFLMEEYSLRVDLVFKDRQLYYRVSKGSDEEKAPMQVL